MYKLKVNNNWSHQSWNWDKKANNHLEYCIHVYMCSIFWETTLLLFAHHIAGMVNKSADALSLSIIYLCSWSLVLVDTESQWTTSQQPTKQECLTRQYQQRHTFALQLPFNHWHQYLQVSLAFLPLKGSILVWPWTTHSRQYISGMMTWLAIFSSCLCCHMSRTELFY